MQLHANSYEIFVCLVASEEKGLFTRRLSDAKITIKHSAKKSVVKSYGIIHVLCISYRIQFSESINQYRSFVGIIIL
jgi:hypothetical protein